MNKPNASIPIAIKKLSESPVKIEMGIAITQAQNII
jgi:hypothetical protein